MVSLADTRSAVIEYILAYQTRKQISSTITSILAFDPNLFYNEPLGNFCRAWSVVRNEGSIIPSS